MSKAVAGGLREGKGEVEEAIEKFDKTIWCRTEEAAQVIRGADIAEDISLTFLKMDLDQYAFQNKNYAKLRQWFVDRAITIAASFSALVGFRGTNFNKMAKNSANITKVTEVIAAATRTWAVFSSENPEFAEDRYSVKDISFAFPEWHVKGLLQNQDPLSFLASPIVGATGVIPQEEYIKYTRLWLERIIKDKTRVMPSLTARLNQCHIYRKSFPKLVGILTDRKEELLKIAEKQEAFEQLSKML